jgi:hypothetical protein
MKTRTATIIWLVCLMSSLPVMILLPEPLDLIGWGSILSVATYCLGYKHAKEEIK